MIKYQTLAALNISCCLATVCQEEVFKSFKKTWMSLKRIWRLRVKIMWWKRVIGRISRHLLCALSVSTCWRIRLSYRGCRATVGWKREAAPPHIDNTNIRAHLILFIGCSARRSWILLFHWLLTWSDGGDQQELQLNQEENVKKAQYSDPCWTIGHTVYCVLTWCKYLTQTSQLRAL